MPVIPRLVPHLDCGTDKLHGNIVRGAVKDDGGVITDFAGDPVEETVLQPLWALRHADMGQISHIAGVGRLPGGRVYSRIMGAHIVCQHTV